MGVNNRRQMAFLYRKQAVVDLAWTPSRHTESCPVGHQILMQPSSVAHPRWVVYSRDLHLDNTAVDALHETALYWVLHRKEFEFDW
jgi:hypothetical protein